MPNFITVCYGTTKFWDNQDDAINFFTDCINNCDAGSSEWTRYAEILNGLGTCSFITDEGNGIRTNTPAMNNILLYAEHFVPENASQQELDDFGQRVIRDICN